VDRRGRGGARSEVGGDLASEVLCDAQGRGAGVALVCCGWRDVRAAEELRQKADGRRMESKSAKSRDAWAFQAMDHGRTCSVEVFYCCVRTCLCSLAVGGGCRHRVAVGHADGEFSILSNYLTVVSPIYTTTMRVLTQGSPSTNLSRHYAATYQASHDSNPT
jgi:hypothetical protein